VGKNNLYILWRVIWNNFLEGLPEYFDVSCLIVAHFFPGAFMHEERGNDAHCLFWGKLDEKVPSFWFEYNEENLPKFYVLAISHHLYEVVVQDKLNVLYHLGEVFLPLWSQYFPLLV